MALLDNPVKQRLSSGGAVVGVFVGSADRRQVELCAAAGFDYVLLDAEHYAFSDSEVEDLIRAAELAGMPAFVRVAANVPHLVRRPLDAGAWGVMIPQVRNRRDVELAVEAAKYGPEGQRGASITRTAGSGTTIGFGDWSRLSNRESMVIVQIETKEAVDNLDDLLDVALVDAFEIGRSDLAQSLGYPGALDHPTVQDYVTTASNKILGAGRVLGDTTDEPAEASRLLSRGYRMVACNYNRIAYRAGRQFVEKARGGDASPDEVSE